MTALNIATRFSGALLVTLICFLGGCGGEDIASEERAAVDFVRDEGGTIEVEDGHVVEVDLNNTDVTTDDLKQLQDLSELQRLVLYGTSVGDEIFDLAESFSDLQYLDISDTQVTQEAANAFTEEHEGVTISGPGA